MSDRCDECKFAVRQPGFKMRPGVLNCRRYPPTVLMMPIMNPITKEVTMQAASHLPAVDDEFGCGEFKPAIILINVQAENN